MSTGGCESDDDEAVVMMWNESSSNGSFGRRFSGLWADGLMG